MRRQANAVMATITNIPPLLLRFWRRPLWETRSVFQPSAEGGGFPVGRGEGPVGIPTDTFTGQEEAARLHPGRGYAAARDLHGRGPAVHGTIRARAGSGAGGVRGGQTVAGSAACGIRALAASAL